MTKDVISLSILVLLLFRHFISHKITFGAPSSGGVLCSACGAFICSENVVYFLCLLHQCSTALQTYLITEVNTINPDQTALMGAREHSGSVVECLTRGQGPRV